MFAKEIPLNHHVMLAVEAVLTDWKWPLNWLMCVSVGRLSYVNTEGISSWIILVEEHQYKCIGITPPQKKNKQNKTKQHILTKQMLQGRYNCCVNKLIYLTDWSGILLFPCGGPSHALMITARPSCVWTVLNVKVSHCLYWISNSKFPHILNDWSNICIALRAW